MQLIALIRHQFCQNVIIQGVDNSTDLELNTSPRISSCKTTLKDEIFIIFDFIILFCHDSLFNLSNLIPMRIPPLFVRGQ